MPLPKAQVQKLLLPLAFRVVHTQLGYLTTRTHEALSGLGRATWTKKQDLHAVT